VIKEIFEQFSENSELGMTVESFTMLIERVDFEGEKPSEKELRLVYYLSLQTQVDELYHTNHLNMVLIEFKEALARLADRTI